MRRLNWLECVHGAADDFPSRTTDWNSHLSNPVLRADWPSPACATFEWAATLRRDGAVPVGNHSAGAPARLQLARDSAVIFWFPGTHIGFKTLANVVGTKACGDGRADGWNKSSAKAPQTVDDEMSMRNPGSMRETYVSEGEARGRSQTAAGGSSTS